MTFDHVVSLGAWCQTIYQIKQQKQPALTTCFDWLVTPWDSIFSILETDGQSFGLHATFDEHSKSVKCDHYGVLYAHEFNPGHAAIGDLSFEQGQALVTEERLKQCRSKMLHKYGSMISTLKRGGHTLFVRFGGTAEPAIAWPYLDDPSPRNEDDLNNLIHLLREKFPQNNAKLLYLWQEPFVHHGLDGSKIDRDVMIMPVPMPPPGKVTWMGEDEVWNRIFNTANRTFNVHDTNAKAPPDPERSVSASQFDASFQA